MPEFDPNWFYSSLAQSAAAIVGLLGGIFAARLQDQITSSREQRLKSINALQGLYTRLIPLREPLSKYLQHTDAQLAELESQIALGKTNMRKAVWYAHTEESHDAHVEVSERMIQVEKDRTSDAKLLLPLIVDALDGNSVKAVFNLERGITNPCGR